MTPSSLPLCEYRHLVINKDCSGSHLFIIIIIVAVAAAAVVVVVVVVITVI